MIPEPAGVFLDTDVVLDHLSDRRPFAEFAHRIFALGETGRLRLHVSSLSFCNLYYILRKFRGHDGAIELLAKLARLVRITSVDEGHVRGAFAGGIRDFEDAVQYASAATIPAVTILITRNIRDFGGQPLQV
jgi:predicted nucleic acid-binding protein